MKINFNTNRLIRPSKIVVLCLLVAPLVVAVLRYLTDQWGANRIEGFIIDTGNWGIRWLIITMAISPIREIFGWNWLIIFRRPIGLAAFYYLCVHFFIYLYLDFGFDLGMIINDLLTSSYVTVGFIGFVLLAPLAITSTQDWIRRLGKRWRLLHRLAYLALIMGLIHYFLQVKIIGFQLWLYIIISVLLLGYRGLSFLWRRRI